jgi:exopolysaccharide transport family protein
MTGVRSTEPDVDIDIASLFVSLWRNKGKILVGSLVAAGLAYGATLAVTPKYNSATRVLIETRESVFTRTNQERSDVNPVLDQQGVKSQVEIMTASDVLRKVAFGPEFGNKLDELPEFDPAKRMSLIDSILVMLSLANDPQTADQEERVLAEMREKLKVYSVEDSRVIVVEFSSADRKLAAKIPNDIASAYLQLQGAAKSQSNSEATEWLEPEIEALRVKVRDAEAKVAAYRSQSDILIGQNNSVLATQQLSELSTELSRVRANRANAEAKAASVRAVLESGTSIDALPDVVASGLIQRLRERQVQLQSEIAELSTTMLDGHPRIKALRSQLENLQKQIGSETRNILESLETESKTAGLREAELVRNLNGLKAESSRVGEEEVELNALEREAKSQRDLLDSYLARYSEAKSRNDGKYQPSDARVISPALVPGEPYFPKKIPIVTAAFAGSLLLLSLLTMLRELFSGRAFRPVSRVMVEEDSVRSVSMPATAVPSAEEPARAPAETSLMSLAPEAESEPVVDPEHTIKAMCERLVDRGAARAIIVSPEGDEAAASSVLIAREMADRGLRSILLDLTQTGAASHPMVDGLALPGITNLLASQAQFKDIIQNDPYSNAHVIPNGTADPQAAMKAVERLPIILNALTTAYDVVIVECGPADAKGIGRLVTPGSEVIISVIDPADKSIVKCAADLQDAGYEDLLIVTPVGSVPPAPQPNRHVA